MRDGAELCLFLDRWLATRRRDASVATIAARIVPSALARGDVPERFVAELRSRLDGLKGLLTGLETDRSAPLASAGARLALWARGARQLVDRWDVSAWSSSALDLSSEKNPLMIAAVSQSLHVSAETLGDAALKAGLRRLREADERPFRSLPVPPGPEASWDAGDYVFPALGSKIAEKARALLGNEAEPPGLAELLALIAEGWPVPRTRLLAALPGQPGREAGDQADRPSEPDHPGTRVKAQGDGPGPAGALLREARDRIAELARSLGASTSAAAREFSVRMAEALARNSASTTEGLGRELTAMLAALDDPADAARPPRWRPETLAALARIGQGIKLGEVLDDSLLGQPLQAWAPFVAVVGNDENPLGGDERRISHVERPGFAVKFSDGHRQPLVRAHVRTS